DPNSPDPLTYPESLSILKQRGSSVLSQPDDHPSQINNRAPLLTPSVSNRFYQTLTSPMGLQSVSQGMQRNAAGVRSMKQIKIRSTFKAPVDEEYVVNYGGGNESDVMS